jgi:hypothetical protein
MEFTQQLFSDGSSSVSSDAPEVRAAQPPRSQSDPGILRSTFQRNLPKPPLGANFVVKLRASAPGHVLLSVCALGYKYADAVEVRIVVAAVFAAAADGELVAYHLPKFGAQ